MYTLKEDIKKHYPQLIPVHISFVLDEKLRFFVDDSMRAHINSKSNAIIRRDKYINPLMDAVASLSKEDLAEMAESLIYLTYLKRRITFKEESVGGPVDVSLITKGDGFIWIKRKHYFDPKLNHHFFKNYHK